MSVEITNLNYVPTLAVRSSEMNGLEKLPAATKDRLQPVFLLAPWPNAGELMKAIDRIERAYPKRSYFLDIDRDYTPTNLEASAQQEWLELRDPANNFANWIGFIDGIPNASPCLQIEGLTEAEVTEQIIAFQEMQRTFALRVETHRIPDNLDDTIAGINAVGSADYVVMIDAGWIADSLTTRAAIGNLIQNAFGDIDAQVPIVVSYTTIPKGYAEVEGTRFTPFDNREFIQELRQLTNRQKLVFGDWGSTRPREAPTPQSPPKPRIDLALRSGWLSARNKPEDWNYSDAATEILESDEWNEVDGLGIWGETMIRQTATNQDVGINSARKNVSVRVNIHLHNQAFYDSDDPKSLNLDEDWED
ncbi:beta family protein [Nitratireductor sp. L1-7-SE]|uniref:Beta family protein n=1 Tax=Nitratireductor rhodophyticola TaxID=2854036 RepID=A0ABS7R2Z5_9HYPH|nr:beta family protein [Nitratireductor rhodophyticola]MBY8915316.1 beta family protein [Nitratireductor rhodophyticola]MBY8919615.1 beta family protein [Nitratireductor rhodophyticola]